MASVRAPIAAIPAPSAPACRAPSHSLVPAPAGISSSILRFPADTLSGSSAATSMCTALPRTHESNDDPWKWCTKLWGRRWMLPVAPQAPAALAAPAGVSKALPSVVRTLWCWEDASSGGGLMSMVARTQHG
eukprot:361982-Chlamydomonas_euryale.AAC.2